MPLRHEAPPQGTMQFQVREATGRFPSGVESGTEGLDLHPIVEKLVSQDYRDECLRLSGVRQPEWLRGCGLSALFINLAAIYCCAFHLKTHP